MRLSSFLLLTALAAPSVALDADAPPAPPATVAEIARAEADRSAFLAALARSPGIAAARQRVDSARRARGAAGVLPDPMIGGEWGRERMTRMGEETDMYGLMLEQTLPRWGELRGMREQADAAVGMAEAMVEETVGEHAATAVAMLAEAEAQAAMAALAERALARMQAMREGLRAEIAAGEARAGESFALDARIRVMELMIADSRRRAEDAAGEARGRLGLSAAEPLPPPAFPDPRGIDAAAVPMAARARAELAMARGMQREAAARRYPEATVGVGWEREEVGTESEADTWALSLRLAIPVYQAAATAGVDAGRARARAAAHDAEAARWMAQAEIDRAARAAAQAERARVTADAVRGQAENEFAALVRQVATGGAMAALAFDVLDRVTEAERQAVMAELDRRMALAGLWRLAPPRLPAAAPAAAPAAHHLPEARP